METGYAFETKEGSFNGLGDMLFEGEVTVENNAKVAVEFSVLKLKLQMEFVGPAMMVCDLFSSC